MTIVVLKMAPHRVKVPRMTVKDPVLKHHISKIPMFRTSLYEEKKKEDIVKSELDVDHEARRRAYRKYLSFIKRKKSEGLKAMDKRNLRDLDAYILYTNNDANERFIYTFGRRLRRHLILNVVQKYAEGKYWQHIRKRNVNAFLTSMRAAMLIRSDKFQAEVNACLHTMKHLAVCFLYPLRFHLFHKKAFTVEQGLALNLEERVQAVRKALKDLDITLNLYETSVLPLTNGNATSKEVLTEVYSDLLGRLADMEECRKLMQVELRMKCKLLPDIAGSMRNEVFDVGEKARVGPVELLDFKEFCMANRHYEVLKVVDKALLDIGILL